MKPFTLSLSNGAQMSEVLAVPPRTSTTPHYYLLVVGLHGGAYFSSYFDADTANSASKIAQTRGTIHSNRSPRLQDSTALPSLPEGSTFLQGKGRYLHHYILPAIWHEYGEAPGATTVVVLARSLGSSNAIVAEALHARESKPAYPYGGLIMSGWGIVPAGPPEAMRQTTDTMTVNGYTQWPLEHKDAPMFGADLKDRAARVSPEILAMTAQLDTPLSRGEIEDDTFH